MDKSGQGSGLATFEILKILFLFVHLKTVNILHEHKHVPAYGLSNLALGNPFHSTLKSRIWSTYSSSHLHLRQNSSSTICSISWPSFRLQLRTFLWWISAFQCRTMLILERALMLRAERRFVPPFHLYQKGAFHFQVLKLRILLAFTNKEP